MENTMMRRDAVLATSLSTCKLYNLQYQQIYIMLFVAFLVKTGLLIICLSFIETAIQNN